MDYKADYIQWLEKNIKIVDLNNNTKILVSPFLDASNDNLEIVIQQDGDNITLSDDGETVSSLNLYGIDIDRNEKHRNIFEKIATNYGISINDDKQLTVSCSPENFGTSVNRLLLCMVNNTLIVG